MPTMTWRRWIGLAGASSALLGCLVLALAATLLDAGKVAQAVAQHLATWTGQPVAMGQVDLVWLPKPGVRIREVRVGDLATSGARQPFLTARAVSLDVSVLALFGGKIVLSSLEIETPELWLDLGPDGVPILPLSGSVPDPGGPADDASLLITKLRVRDGSARIGPWKLAGIRVSGGPASEQSARFEVSAEVADLGELDGRISVSSRAEGGIAWESRLEMHDLNLTALDRPTGTESEISGSGRAVLVASGENDKLGDASLELDLRAVDLRAPALRIHGDLDFSARLGGPWTLDLGAARVQLANLLTKSPGVPTQLDGFVPRARAARAWDSWTLHIGSDELHGALRFLADGPQVELSGSIAFASLLGWTTASGLPSKGRLHLARIEYAPPLRLSGEGSVDNAVLPLGPDRSVSFSGPFSVAGSVLRTDGLGIEFLGERLGLSGSYDFARDQIDLVARADGLELGPLSKELQGKARIAGRLYGRAELHGHPRLDAISGKGEVTVENGEILNISLPTLLTSAGTRATDQEPFRGLRGRFIIRDQKLDFSELVLEQSPASASLRGSLSLTDGGLNLDGDVRYGDDTASRSSRIWVTGSIQQLQWSLDSEYAIDKETRWKMERETLEGIKRAVEELGEPAEPERAAAYRNQIQFIEQELERYADPGDTAVQ